MKRAEVEDTPREPKNELLDAARNGTVHDLRQVLARDPNLEARSANGKTAWHYAFSAGDLDKARALLAAGCDRHAVMNGGGSAVHIAARDEDASMLRWLLEQGFDVDHREENSWTPLHVAAAFGRVASAQLLVASGADLFARDIHDLEPLAFRLLGGAGAAAQRHDHILCPGITQVQGVCMALTAVTDDCNLLPLDQVDVCVPVIINAHEVSFPKVLHRQQLRPCRCPAAPLEFGRDNSGKPVNDKPRSCG